MTRAGPHALEVRFQARHPDTVFDLYWRPPGGPRAPLPPTALIPATGGAWLAAERLGVSAPDPALLR